MSQMPILMYNLEKILLNFRDAIACFWLLFQLKACIARIANISCNIRSGLIEVVKRIAYFMAQVIHH